MAASDRPIVEASQDRLGRASFAALVANELASLDADGGFVAAITGRWGAGKTSVLTLIESELPADAICVWFNPWLFAGADELVLRFLVELERQLEEGSASERLTVVRQRLASYLGVLRPLSGVLSPRLEKLLEAIGSANESAGSSAGRLKGELADALRESGTRVYVFIDDLDRLDDRETAEVLRLVKLVADLPNLVYVLAYDRPRVEDALGTNGRAYLEKIVQVSHDLPAPLPSRLRELALAELSQRIDAEDEENLDTELWGQLFGGAIAEYLSTMRDAKRYANIAPLRLRLLRGEVAPQDVLALEALRLFEPDVHARLPGLRGVLTGTSTLLDLRSEQERREQARAALARVLNEARSVETTTQLVRTLFPAAASVLDGIGGGGGNSRALRAASRVAVAEVFDVYLHAQFGDEGVATPFIRKLVDALDEPATLAALLAETSDAQLHTVLDRARDFREEFPTGQPAMEAAEAFFALFDRIDEGRLSASQLMPGTWALRFIIEALGEKLPSPDQTQLAETLYIRAPHACARWHVLAWYGTSSPNQDAGGTKTAWLGAAETAARWQQLRDEVRTVAPDALARQSRLFSLLLILVAGEDDEAGRDAVRERLTHDSVLLALLGELGRYSDGWTSLGRIVGEDFLADRVADLIRDHQAESLPEHQRRGLANAQRRLAGELDDW